LLLVHVPPEVGDKEEVDPSQMVVDPVIETVGGFVTDKFSVGSLEQLFAVLVNVKLAVPVLTPVTTPALVTVAMATSELVHVPPVDGESWVVESLQITVDPIKSTPGLGETVTSMLSSP
jgi:hypothetical protein